MPEQIFFRASSQAKLMNQNKNPEKAAKPAKKIPRFDLRVGNFLFSPGKLGREGLKMINDKNNKTPVQAVLFAFRL